MRYIRMWEEYVTNFQSDRKASNEIKHRHIPKQLFKYVSLNGEDKVREKKLDSIKNNKQWVSKATEFNDPFDCYGFYFNEDVIKERLITQGISISGIDFSALMKMIRKDFSAIRSYMQVASFSENLFNMPMWAHYADNHKGICIEFNFNQLESEHDFTKMLFPVAYEKKRYDLTGMLNRGLMSKSNAVENDTILFFTLMLKHDSWAYEQEWRYLHPDFSVLERMLKGEDAEGGSVNKGDLVDIPVQPTAIYFGQNCSDEIIADIGANFQDTETGLYKMEMGIQEFFHLSATQIIH